MWAIIKKEISTYFSSLIGYMAFGIFFILNGLIFWVFPSTSILKSGYAQLESFFQLTPFLLMFLIPAITMKTFAGERQEGTLDWLRTSPLLDWQLVAGKFISTLLIGSLAISPTILYTFSIYFLALPKGNIDLDAIIGSYLGLHLLLTVYIAIGLWCSIRFKNVILSFLAAVTCCFIFIYGISAFLPLVTLEPIDQILGFLDLNKHYESIGRGVLDSRSVIGFLTFTTWFLFLTYKQLEKDRSFRKPGAILNYLSILVFLLAIQIASSRWYARLDFTQDKRYSLSNTSKSVINQIDDEISIQVLLQGEIHPSFKRLQQSLKDLLLDLQSLNKGKIEIQWIDPLETELRSTESDPQLILQQLAERGIQPLQIHLQEGLSQTQRIIFPYAIIQNGKREIIINLLHSNQSGSYEETINTSIEELEFQFISAFQKLKRAKKPVIAFSQGHGELERKHIFDAAQSLSQAFQVIFLDFNQVLLEDLPKIDVLVIAKPTREFSEIHKMKLDYFVMQGGKLILAIDQLTGGLDSLKSTGYQNIIARNLMLDDLFFTYGFRLNYDLLADLQASEILVTQNKKDLSGKPLDHAPWPFHPLISGSVDKQHPVFKNLDPVGLQYAGTIDTIPTEGIKKTFAMYSSLFNQSLEPPLTVSLDLLSDLPDPDNFQSAAKPTALWLEGVFPSAFYMRKKPMELPISFEYPDKSTSTQIMVIADGDVFKNAIHEQDQSTFPLGWDPVTRRTNGNKTLLMNAIDYMIDGSESLIPLRDKEFNVRLLDQILIKKSGKYWQIAQFLVPLSLLLFAALGQRWLRQRKYASKKNY